MAEDVLERCFEAQMLPARPGGGTACLPLLGAPKRSSESLTQPPGEHLYGVDAPALRELPGAQRWLWRDGGGGISEAMVRFAARFEMARDVEDVLARRCRLLFLDARQAAALADDVAALLREELGDGFDAPASAHAFKALADQYASVP
jgi:glycerol-3-phosphate dehydrogenase